MATFNVHWGRDRRGTPFALAEALARLDADVVALQEVWCDDAAPDALRATAERAGYALHEAVMSPRADLEGYRLDVTGATTPGRWGSAVLLRGPCRAESTTVLGKAPRDAERWVHLVTTAVGETPVPVAHVHLTHRFPLSILQLRRAGAELRRAGGHGILLGDTNLPPALTRRVTGLAHGLRAPTWPSGRPVLQPDQVLLTPGWVVEGASVVTGLGSDHDAVRVALRLDPGEGQAGAQRGRTVASGSSTTSRPSAPNSPTRLSGGE